MIEEQGPVFQRLVAPAEASEEQALPALRPSTLEEFIGQADIKARLAIAIGAARARGDLIEHTLLAGPPGLGKTTMALVLAKEMGVQTSITAGPVLERPGDLAAILTKLGRGDVLFIDEIHRLSRPVEEVLYTAMEDFKIDLMIGKGPTAQTLRLDVAPFTLVGATTRAGLLTGALRERFGHHFVFEYYAGADLVTIILRSARILGLSISSEAAEEIAHRSRGTPRVANRLLRRVRDHAQVHGAPSADAAVARGALEMLGIDPMGLDRTDRRMMEYLCHTNPGIPVGLKTIAVVLGEDPQTLEEVYEPYLIQIGFLHRTPRGRMATARAMTHFGRPFMGQHAVTG